MQEGSAGSDECWRLCDHVFAEVETACALKCATRTQAQGWRESVLGARIVGRGQDGL